MLRKQERGIVPAEPFGVVGQLKYRADIDGLRAIAVLSVVIFHLDVPGFQGGYVGVDIFFVISGYLITSIIKHKYDSDTFKLSHFYARRIRRLVPPLIATVAATILGAAFIMTPYDMVELSRSAVAALFSLSNFVFYSESGYWDTASELKPLLHTWSLGVEEQFYLFWPALIVGLLSIRRHISFGTSLALISLLGAALCIWFTSVDQSAAFYLLPFRVFQFAVGAWIIPLTLGLQDSPKKHTAWIPALSFWLGILCVVISVTAFGDNTVFPGWAVLVPTTGAALILISGALPGQTETPARSLMQNPVSIWLGRVSYSMYLVHWPLIVLFRYHYGLELTVADQFILAISTLLATCALHYRIERRFYQRDAKAADGSIGMSGNRFALQTMGVAGLLALITSSAWVDGGWAWLYPTARLSTEQIKQGEQARVKNYDIACSLEDLQSNKACNFYASIQMLVLGNSHEPDGYNFIKSGFGDDKNLNIMVFGRIHGCGFTRNNLGQIHSSDRQCQKRLAALFEPELAASIDIVLYSAAKPYDQSKHAFVAILQQLKKINPEVRIITFGGYIETKRDCSYYIAKTHSADACALPENVTYFEGNSGGKHFLKYFRTIESHYIDRVSLLCKNGALDTCRTSTDDGVPVSYDDGHNSLEFSQMSGKIYAEKYPNLLHSLKAP
jgi:peptidoglycan/LPS O-acetylase OafA/YrhL